MDIGQKVIMIVSLECHDCFGESLLATLPIGAIGEIESNIDEYNEYDVLFPDYPCPALPESWVVHKSQMIPINEEKQHSKPLLATIDK